MSGTGKGLPRAVRRLAATAAVAAVALAVLWRGAPLWAGGALGAGIALVAVRAAGRAGPALALSVFTLAVAGAELGLRAAGFERVSGVQFGYPTPELFWRLEPDPELLWRLPVDDEDVNELGFLGPAPEVPKPDGTFRILVLGDSCSQQGWPEGWPEILAELLDAESRPVDVANLSCSGYSSFQGLAVARRHAAELAPDLIVVYFGWNDHWLAVGASDAEKAPDMAAERAYRSVRLLQAAAHLAPRPPATRGDAVRVPKADYRANLLALVELAERIGARIVLATAPSAHRTRGVPEYLVQEGFAESPRAVLELHAEYGEVVREVAGSTDAVLLDLEREYANPELAAAFLRDGIHFDERGRFDLARRVAGFLLEQGLVPGGAR